MAVRGMRLGLAKPSTMNDVERDPADGSPVLPPAKESEIEAFVDPKHRGEDGIFRPVIVSQDEEFLNLSMKDAQRLLDFLNDAIPYLEGKVTWIHQ